MINTGVLHDANTRKVAGDYLKKLASNIKFAILLAGAISSNIFDALIGGIMLSLILSNVDVGLGKPWSGVILGALGSLMLSFIQLILWDIILRGGLTLSDIPLLILAIIVAIGDTNVDISPIYKWVAESFISSELRQIKMLFPFSHFTLYDFVTNSIFWSFYIAMMFSEAFNVWLLDRSFTASTPARIQHNHPRAVSPTNKFFRRKP